MVETVGKKEKKGKTMSVQPTNRLSWKIVKTLLLEKKNR